MSRILARTLGAYPISIATSLAIESITNAGDFINNRNTPAVMSMEALYINIRTLYRNVMGSVLKPQRPLFTDASAYESILADITYINQIIHSVNPSVKVVIYVSNYKKIISDDNWVKKKATVASTMSKIYEDNVIYRAIHEDDIDILEFDDEIKGELKTTILTHIPYDLLSSHNFRDLQLLESHTGAIKTKYMWSTKLRTAKDVHIPFFRETLAIFGDSYMIAGVDKKIKDRVIEISKLYNWTPATTRSKMRANISAAFEPFIIQYMNKVD